MHLSALPRREALLAILRRVDDAAHKINPFLFIVAVGLASLEFLYVCRFIAEALPPVVLSTGYMP